MEHGTRGVHISAGDGIVAHVANLTAHATGEESRLNELLVRLNALAGEPWQEIVRTLTTGITEAGYDGHPALACVAVEDDKVAALVFGEASLSVTIDGAETILDGRDSSTWIDVALRGTVERVHAGQQSDSTIVGVLRDGVIPAGGFLLDTSGPIPASGRWGEIMTAATDEPPVAQLPPVNDPVPDSPGHTDHDAAPQTNDVAPAPTARSMFARIEEVGRVGHAVDEEQSEQTSEELFSESPFAERATPAASNGPDAPSGVADEGPGNTLAPARPQLKGVLCDVGHLTAPLETSCRTCGEHLSAEATAATGNRPALGILTFDDGAVLNIDRPAAIGADVPSGYVIDGEPATIVRLDDGAGGVSDIQLEVRLSGWNVEIVDMDSENGTYTMLRGERQTRTKLRSGQPVVLQQEMEVQTGGRSFVFSSGTAGPAS